MPNHILHCETGHFELTGSDTKAFLGANYTGRSIDVEGAYRIAKDWINQFEKDHKIDYELEIELLESLEMAPTEVYDASFYRGRFFVDPPTSCMEFGPPPVGKSGAGRYNVKGSPALYLCSSSNGVNVELEAYSQEGNLWIQRFKLLPELSLADARCLGLDSLSAATFWLIESQRDREDRPLLGQRLAAVIGSEYDGMLVPGVRGAVDQLYWNVVIFRPEEVWTQLVDMTANPKRFA